MREIDTVQEEDTEEVDNFGQGGFNRARKFIWELFEEPNKSKLGKVLGPPGHDGMPAMLVGQDTADASSGTVLTPNAHLIKRHVLCLCTFRACAHFVLVLTTHNAVLSCTGQWMYSAANNSI